VQTTSGVGFPRSLEENRLPRSSDRLIGTIVHRLFQRLQSIDRMTTDRQRLAAFAATLVRTEERVDTGDLDDIARAASDMFLGLHGRPDVAAVLSSGDAFYEVPFSFAPNDRPGEVIRGIIDCLVVPGQGPPVVVEFKTGAPRPEHAAQVESYAAAIREILAINRVETKILYA
jgi:hypothetical protein